MSVNLEIMGENTLTIPEFFVSLGKPDKKGKMKVKLVNPLTKSRHLATRDGQTPFRIIRKPIDEMILLENHTHPIPLRLFSKKDREIIVKHFEVVESHRGKPINEIPNTKDFKNKERGRPPHLPKNIKWHMEHKTIPKGKKVNIKQVEPKTLVIPQGKKVKIKPLPANIPIEEPLVIPQGKKVKIKPFPANIPIEEPPIKMKILKIKKAVPKISEPIIEEPEMPIIEKKSRGRPKKYSTDAERKAMKLQQTLASNKRKLQERREAKGKGIWDNIKKTANKAVSGANKITNTVVKGVNKVINDASAYKTAILEGRNDYPPKCRKILKENGDAIITGMKIKRTPVPSILTSALSGLSFGQFGKNQKEAGFDTLFHLFLEMQTVNGRRLQVEKNEVINMDIDPPEKPNTEMRIVKNVPQGLTFQQIMDATQKRQGDKFFKYSARDNNCQDFILALFQANGAGDTEDYAFIKQDTKKLYDGLMGLRKISNTLTDIGGRANVVMEGVGVGGNGDLIHLDLNSHNGKNYKMGEGVGVKNKISTRSIKGMGKKLFDQKFSMNQIKHFVKKDILGKKDEVKPKTNSILDQEFSVNEAVDAGKHLFGKGYEGSDSEARVHRSQMGNGIVIHQHHHHHHHYKGMDSDSDDEPMGGKLKMSNTSKKIVKGLKTVAHYAIPAATSALGAMAATAIAPELGPISGVAGGAYGSYVGKKIDDKLGVGLKGSQEMKDKMARIRAMRK
jgi:hypothetical protein